MSQGLMYYHEPTSASPFIDYEVTVNCWLYAECENSGLNAEGGVDFNPLHHRADAVLTPAGPRKARGTKVISQWMCVFTCVSVTVPSVSLNINGFTDIEKAFRLKCALGPRIPEGLQESLCYNLPSFLICFVCAEHHMCVSCSLFYL